MYYQLNPIDWCTTENHFYLVNSDFQDFQDEGYKVIYLPFVARCPFCYSHTATLDKLYPVVIVGNWTL